MARMWRNSLVSLAALTVAVVGAIDAGRDRNGDLVVVFLVIAGLQLAQLVGGRPRDRRPVLVRRDLADWIDEQALATGDTVDQVADRMVVQHRSIWSSQV